jgi:hypothetical protein
MRELISTSGNRCARELVCQNEETKRKIEVDVEPCSVVSGLCKHPYLAYCLAFASGGYFHSICNSSALQAVVSRNATSRTKQITMAYFVGI